MSSFHERLHDFIAFSGLTLDEISERSGVSTKTIQNWTRDKRPTMPRIEQGVKVAHVLGVSADYLVTGRISSSRVQISEGAMKVALAAEELTDEGKEIALSQVKSLAAHFPRGSTNPTGRKPLLNKSRS